MTTVTPPILFLIFNRADKTKQVFERIRAQRPERLYVAADGPRPGHPTDAQACATTRAIVDDVDWPCDVKTLFRGENLGCRSAVSGALDWFFEHEPEGIIIEDDILLDPSFFAFAAEMLERYRTNPKVMTISASNLVSAQGAPTQYAGDDSYTFSMYAQIWGWATWRETWKLYDHTLATLEDPQSISKLKATELAGLDMMRHWMRRFRRVKSGETDTWDYSLIYLQWLHGGLSVIPRVNMMHNIGFDETATHTTDPNHEHGTFRAEPLPYPLKHPTEITRNDALDIALSRGIFKIQDLTMSRRIKRWFKAV